MADTMKTLLLCLLLLGANPKPYDGASVIIKATRANGSDLRIDAESAVWIAPDIHHYRHFVFSCRTTAANCAAPRVGSQYTLLIPPKPTTCDGYNLGDNVGGDPITVCLISVSEK